MEKLLIARLKHHVHVFQILREGKSFCVLYRNYSKIKPRSGIKGICSLHSFLTQSTAIPPHLSSLLILSSLFSSYHFVSIFQEPRLALKHFWWTAWQLKPTAHIAIWTKHITIHTTYCTCAFTKLQTSDLQLSGTQLIYLCAAFQLKLVKPTCTGLHWNKDFRVQSHSPSSQNALGQNNY